MGKARFAQESVCREVYLFVDQRSKERHSHLHFDGYIETRVFTERTSGMHFLIRHEDSRVVKDLSTADYISWSIFRLLSMGISDSFPV